MHSFDRRKFFELLAAFGCGSFLKSALAQSASDAVLDHVLPHGSYHPGRINNEYSLFLPGEDAALQTPPTISDITLDVVTARFEGQVIQLRTHDQMNGWRLLAIAHIDDSVIAIFEKNVTYRGAIAYVSTTGIRAIIPKQVGELAQIRPRQLNTPHGVKFERATHYGPDIVGQYILNSAEDPCYDNVAALGSEYIGWTLIANEEAGPEASLFLEPSGKSRELKSDSGMQALWGPDSVGQVFDPTELIFQSPSDGFSSKRTLLGGYLPVANLAVWDPIQQSGYEVIVLLPPGKDSKPMARLRSTISSEMLAFLDEVKTTHPEFVDGVSQFEEGGRTYIERYWNGTPQEFHIALSGLWNKWRKFHDGAMHVEIPDEWLLNAARAGITLARCSYTGLEPAYQIGEGVYTKVPPSASALFPVAHCEFIWAHQLWNQCESADAYFQYYLDHYVLPDGDFAYNTQEQVEAPLNIGIVLMNSARGYFYTRDLISFEKRLPVLDRMIAFVLRRYEQSKLTFPASDRRHGLIWGSPEADLGDPKKDVPANHAYYYQNAACIWRGLEQHARALSFAGQACGKPDLNDAATRYRSIAQDMRARVEASLRATLMARNSKMSSAGITPFTPNDISRDPEHLESYENHRFMEDWFLADWGDRSLDLGHLKHRMLAHKQCLGLGTSDLPFMTSNFMAHGTLSVLIRQSDYRPFLLNLYALTCYAADSGNRYAPEDAFIPGGHPLEGWSGMWAAVVNSTLQPALGLRWLLCYEESDRDICHLQKAAPKHWFSKGEVINVRNCPTRFGAIDWSTRAVTERRWNINVSVPRGFDGDLIIHVHPPDGKMLNRTSEGELSGNTVVLHKHLLRSATSLAIEVS